MTGVKEKGMEAILRMRQLGGVEARAIVLCGASQEAQQLIQAELREETGRSSQSLEIWGKNTWYDLRQTFHRYIRAALRLGVNNTMLQNVRFARYRFTYTVREPLKMPAYKGNIFRSRFG